MNSGRFVPPVVEIGLYDYPVDPIGEMKAAGVRTIAFDATEIAQGLGDVRLGNTVMLGAIADYLPFSAEVLLKAILQRFAHKSEKVQAMNREAFAAGRAAVGTAQAA